MPETIYSRNQAVSQIAFEKVSNRQGKPEEEQYGRFAKSFPCLIHTCGLTQALAYADAKKHKEYLEDLAKVLNQKNADAMMKASREKQVTEYLRFSRDAINAAGWLKRYAEAMLKGADE